MADVFRGLVIVVATAGLVVLCGAVGGWAVARSTFGADVASFGTKKVAIAAVSFCVCILSLAIVLIA